VIPVTKEPADLGSAPPGGCVEARDGFRASFDDVRRSRSDRPIRGEDQILRDAGFPCYQPDDEFRMAAPADMLRSAWMAALVLAQLSSYSYQRVRWTSLGGSGGTSARITFSGPDWRIVAAREHALVQRIQLLGCLWLSNSN
jgi:hypothetical protein